MTSKFGKQVHLQDLTQIKQVLLTSLRQDHMTNLKHYISITRVPMVTKLGRLVTYLDEFLPINSNGLLITWPFKIT